MVKKLLSKAGTASALAAAILVTALAGCGGDDADKPAASGKNGLSAGSLAALAKADAADGAPDKVVSKCPTCMLAMDGKAAFSATCGEYTVHLCSEGCKEAFAKDPEGALAKLP